MNWQDKRNFAGGITDFIFTEDPPSPSDIIFIPGNAYPQMAEEAAVLYKKGLAKWILPSGKYYIYDTCFNGPKVQTDKYHGNYETEWDFLFDVLVKNGVPSSAVLKENRAAYTYENALNSRIVTDGAGIDVRSAIVCCLSVHSRRCRMYYQLVYPEARILIHPTPANGITKSDWMNTDEGIGLVLGEVERCGWQFKEILEEMKDS